MKSKVIQHPSSGSTPAMTVAEAVGLSSVMSKVLIIYADKNTDEYHIAWSEMDDRDLAATGVIICHIAASRLVD